MEAKPLEVYPVHDYLRSRLCSLYENDSIFDRFECGWNGDDSYPLHTKCLTFLQEFLPLECLNVVEAVLLNALNVVQAFSKSLYIHAVVHQSIDVVNIN